MRGILKLAEEYVSDVKQMNALNVEDARKLKYSVSVRSLYQASSARGGDLALGLIETLKEVIESASDSRVDTFLGAIDKLLDAGIGEVSDSEMWLKRIKRKSLLTPGSKGSAKCKMKEWLISIAG